MGFRARFQISASLRASRQPLIPLVEDAISRHCNFGALAGSLSALVCPQAPREICGSHPKLRVLSRRHKGGNGPRSSPEFPFFPPSKAHAVSSLIWQRKHGRAAACGSGAIWRPIEQVFLKTSEAAHSHAAVWCASVTKFSTISGLTLFYCCGKLS